MDNIGCIICVNYNSWNDTLSFFESIEEKNRFDFFVIDNSPELNTKQKNNMPKKINYYVGDNKLGYYNNVYRLRKKIELSKYLFVIVSNVDVEFISKKNVKKILNTLKQYDIIAPSIINLDLKQQNPFRKNKISRFDKYFWSIAYSNFFLFKILFFSRSLISNFLKIKNFKINETQIKIWAPHGAFVIFSNDSFKKIFSEKFNFWLYGEEDYIGNLSYKLNLKVMFNPKIKILHKEGISSSSFSSLRKYKLYKQAYYSNYDQ